MDWAIHTSKTSLLDLSNVHSLHKNSRILYQPSLSPTIIALQKYEYPIIYYKKNPTMSYHIAHTLVARKLNIVTV